MNAVHCFQLIKNTSNRILMIFLYEECDRCSMKREILLRDRCISIFLNFRTEKKKILVGKFKTTVLKFDLYSDYIQRRAEYSLSEFNLSIFSNQ